MFLVGLTGGIASGKSAVSLMLRLMDCEVIDADEIAREGQKIQRLSCKNCKKGHLNVLKFH